jgi:hypothetical protein
MPFNISQAPSFRRDRNDKKTRSPVFIDFGYFTLNFKTLSQA